MLCVFKIFDFIKTKKQRSNKVFFERYPILKRIF